MAAEFTGGCQEVPSSSTSDLCKCWRSRFDLGIEVSPDFSLIEIRSTVPGKVIELNNGGQKFARRDGHFPCEKTDRFVRNRNLTRLGKVLQQADATGIIGRLNIDTNASVKSVDQT